MGFSSPKPPPAPVKIDDQAVAVRAADARRRRPGITAASTRLVPLDMAGTAAKTLTGM